MLLASTDLCLFTVMRSLFRDNPNNLWSIPTGLLPSDSTMKRSSNPYMYILVLVIRTMLWNEFSGVEKAANNPDMEIILELTDCREI
jgi:hypothetical protein